MAIAPKLTPIQQLKNRLVRLETKVKGQGTTIKEQGAAIKQLTKDHKKNIGELNKVISDAGTKGAIKKPKKKPRKKSKK